MDLELRKRIKRESKTFPRWLANTLSKNFEIKYHFFLREKRAVKKNWTPWSKAVEFSIKSLLTYKKQFKKRRNDRNPYWKYRAIQAANLVNKVYVNASDKKRAKLSAESLNIFARRKDLHVSVDPIQRRMIHLDTNRLGCFVRDFNFSDERKKPKNWIEAAKQNYLRILRTDFFIFNREFTNWELCYKNNRGRLDSTQRKSAWYGFLKRNLCILIDS
ncbi:hypothetical protein [Leptospira santarosai]|uniref:Uncharacterized protein n=1 Tax=Leptospira santarosai serovar Arenal str. MAVJ 401 TaxID=1049976 RepID=M6K025_9LEPT|nr:hypothetical protein [Leptospira santarosai]EMN21097.1 hypothetical protein LEP1GSC063_1245 [Leptospira santarosai serovar Arenal str. MAVJ 401]